MRPDDWRYIAVVGLFVFALAILAITVGLILLGLHGEPQDAVTALAAMGTGLAGGFAGWIGRGIENRHGPEVDHRRRTDPDPEPEPDPPTEEP